MVTRTLYHHYERKILGGSIVRQHPRQLFVFLKTLYLYEEQYAIAFLCILNAKNIIVDATIIYA